MANVFSRLLSNIDGTGSSELKKAAAARGPSSMQQDYDSGSGDGALSNEINAYSESVNRTTSGYSKSWPAKWEGPVFKSG